MNKFVRNNCLYVMLAMLISLSAYGQNDISGRATEVKASDADTCSNTFHMYADSIQRMSKSYLHSFGSDQGSTDYKLSPYFFQMITPATFYKQPLSQAFGIQWNLGKDGFCDRLLPKRNLYDDELYRLSFSYQALGYLYSDNPGLVTATESDIEESGKVMKDMDAPIKTETSLLGEITLGELEQEDIGVVEAILRKPNFWKFKGSNELHVTQNYATDNWFQGKANHYNVLGVIVIEANFDNKRKIQCDNRLDIQLGFQTNSDNEYQKFKPTNNLVRLNTKLGLKAAKNWNYAFSVKAETQLVPNNNYSKDGKKTLITDFMAPLNLDLAVGVDWKWNLKKFTGSLMLAPGTYNFKYVDRLSLSTRYLGGDKEGHHTKHTFGPSATCRFNWKIMQNISWDGRLYWISNLSYTNIEFENTITFSINKYFTSKFFFYPRFNDMSKNNRKRDADGNPTGTYWMFKEWLSLGVSYSW